MHKPDYAHWAAQPEYSIYAAAYLCCDSEPDDVTRDRELPIVVREMKNRLLVEVPYRENRNDFDIPYIKQADLREWAIKTGCEDRVPFLFPVEVSKPKRVLDDDQMRRDTKESYLVMIGLLSYLVMHRSGPAMKSPRGGVNQSLLCDEIQRQAERLGIPLDGLSKSGLQSKLKDAFGEIENRR